MAIAKRKNPNAWVVSYNDRGRKSIKNGKVFLKNNEEFQIELFNPLKTNVLSKIKLNGNNISKSGLVIRPGERIYLDCFLDDNRKFIFKTYDIENSSESLEATQDNGLLEVHFYQEKVVTQLFDGNYGGYGNYRSYYSGNIGTGGGLYDGTFTTNTTNMNYSSTIGITGTSYFSNDSVTLDSMYVDDNKDIETGRVEKGNKSDQEFESIDMDFHSYQVSSTIIKMLPDSMKPIESKDLKNLKPDSVIELIKQLKVLHDDGTLCDEEFEKAKSKLLSRI